VIISSSIIIIIAVIVFSLISLCSTHQSHATSCF